MATKKRQRYEFDERDIGTWIDGALGEEHAMTKMAEMLTDVATARANSLLEEYDADEIDEEFEQEWLDDATEELQVATKDGLVWEWEAGDLFLVREEDAE